jgi:uncharacterized protein YlxW (UPF0749 family)
MAPSRAASRHDVHVHIYEGDVNFDITSLERKIDQLMAKIDDLSNEFSALDSSVRTLITSISTVEGSLRAEIETLRADDAIEDTKLEGLMVAASDLRGAVETFGQEAPIDVPVNPETLVEPTDPNAPA